ncbi:Protein C2-DOMAIN ABA-RELATED like [Quillaja saponaria]|uniref:Protein C2-DOMAIN ABA-RELATED like n=1 Tax=Quillaja saponaria TaxID=32244 RepID=A0AAD7LPV5_QUISA|nr:Protein C2-DOMAIN ABA-RELATED like [Quillaja saponaria]KAJ7962149.1 Protein C2-DOMAIN ABA-RELATED like [Quillaja saponaria]
MATTGKDILHIHVKRGVNLVVSDVNSSDPFVQFWAGNQKRKTKAKRNDLNPEWHQELELPITDPSVERINLIVYDHDTFSRNDKMGEAYFDIKKLKEVTLKNKSATGPSIPRSGTVISKIQPSEHDNCLDEESCIFWSKGKVVQDLVLRLSKEMESECGEVELRLQWVPAAS